LIASYGTSCTTSGWYHGGVNMCGSSASHPKDPTSGLKGGPPNESPPTELPLGESLSCPLFGGW
jgi:hypothetical protein